MQNIILKKLYKNDLTCSLGCLQTEDQVYIFKNCMKLNICNTPVIYADIYGTLCEQENIIKTFIKKDRLRNHIKKKHILPGGDCQDPCTFGLISYGAAYIISY